MKSLDFPVNFLQVYVIRFIGLLPSPAIRAPNTNVIKVLRKEVRLMEIRGLRVDSQAHTCTLYGKEGILTPTEFSILLLLCQNKGKAISSERLFEPVWGVGCKIEE